MDPETTKPRHHWDARGFSDKLGFRETLMWSRRQESNLYLALRRHLFYPLNYGETRGTQSFKFSPEIIAD
jgi:hypothetical protein